MCNIIAKGANQFVVHEAFEIIFIYFLYYLWFTPKQKIGVLSFGGADITTFLAPFAKCFWEAYAVKKTPDHYATY